MCAISCSIDCYRERLQKGGMPGYLAEKAAKKDVTTLINEKIADLSRKEAKRYIIFNAVVHMRNLRCNFYSTCLYLFLLSVVLIIPRKEAAVAAKDSGESKDN